MTSDEDRIKSLLGRAFGPEPPLRLDRDEILRRGRRGVRLRLLAASGGVAAAVVAVVLGAAALSNLTGDDPGPGISPGQATSSRPPYPPTSSPVSAAPTPESAPQGPQLPLSPTTTAPSKHADVLTQVLADAKLIPVVADGGDGSKALSFSYVGERYQVVTDLRQPQGAGHVRVQISRRDKFAPPVSCSELTGQSDPCAIEADHGTPVLVATERFGREIRYVVHVVRPDGSDILVTASNVLTSASGATSVGGKPPVDIEVLKKIATLPRLTFG